jgi:hypothetical protein
MYASGIQPGVGYIRAGLGRIACDVDIRSEATVKCRLYSVIHFTRQSLFQ